MEQLQQGFRDSRQVVTYPKSRQKVCLLSQLQLLAMSPISTQKYESGHIDPY